MSGGGNGPAPRPEGGGAPRPGTLGAGRPGGGGAPRDGLAAGGGRFGLFIDCGRTLFCGIDGGGVGDGAKLRSVQSSLTGGGAGA